MQELLTRDYGETFRLIWEIIMDPASKPTEAMLAFAVIVIILVIAMIAVILLVMRGTEDEDESPTGDRVDAVSAQRVRTDSSAESGATTVSPRRVSTRWIVVGTLLLWWFATGLMTTLPSVCESCHVDGAHTTTNAADPHEATSCIRCHEAGGYVGALTTGVPSRVSHIVSGVLSDDMTGSYGFISSGACAQCHDAQIADTTTNELRAVKMSHVEPIEAGAQCLDCHRLSEGVVGLYTTGMRPCLLCHDNDSAPGECSYCHTGDIALAITSSSRASTSTAQRLIPNPDCGGCHDQTSCDACHGLRMPHSAEFMEYAHARQGVEDIWFNAGRTCGKCHSDQKRPCTTCHKGSFSSHGSGLIRTHSSGTSVGCDVCHSAMAYRPRRDFCIDLCHQPQAP